MTTLQHEDFSSNLQEVAINYDLGKKRVQKVACPNMWNHGCLNKSCPAFRNENGYYYCIRK